MENKKQNTINIWAADKIIKIGKMFENEIPNLKLGSIFIQKTDLKFVKKDLDLHSSAIDQDNSVIAFCMLEDEKVFHRHWFKLVGYDDTEFEHWKLIREDIEYR